MQPAMLVQFSLAIKKAGREPAQHVWDKKNKPAWARKRAKRPAKNREAEQLKSKCPRSDVLGDLVELLIFTTVLPSTNWL